MALSETARLIASLELQDKFSKNAAAFDRSVGALERRAGTFSKIGDQVGRGLSSATANLTRIGVVGAGLLTAAVTNGVRELEKLENASAQTNAVIQSTQGVAGQTAESIRALAEKYEGLNATIDDKVIQSGENLLLTFTNINKEGFEPALQAALDLNTALKGGEEGLQGTIIQVGKALQDPIRGLTALRRVGVNFTDQQKKQIKDLVAQNKLYDAQQIILKELTTEFGGSFAAAGNTATGKFAKLKDTIEDAQAALATAFLPILTKVADKLGTFLADPATVQRIEDFGGQLAAGFDTVLEKVGQLDFAAIGNALTIAGTGAKAVFDAFTGLPPWIQTAVLTGWGLNKLTGGALTGIAGTIGKALLGGALGNRGATPANPVFVSQVGGIGGAPVGAPTGGPLAFLGKLLLGATAVAGGALIGNAIARPTFNATVEPAVKFEETQFSKLIATADPSQLQGGLDSINKALDFLGADNILGNLIAGDQIKVLQDQKTILQQKLDKIARVNAADSGRWTGLFETTRANTADSARWTGLANSQLTSLNGKNFSPTVKVDVSATTNVSVSNVERTLISHRIAGSTTIGGFTESAF